MTNIFKQTRVLFAALLVFFLCCAGGTAAQADILDDIASVLDEMGPANPYASQGLSGDTIRGAKGLINDLANGEDPLQTIAKYKDSDLGQQMAQGNVPGWFWDFVDLYVAWKEGSLQGVIQHLGTGAICLVAQFFTGGWDLCGALKELIALAEDIVGYMADVFEDIGEAILETVKGVYCALTNCDDPEPPPEVKAWHHYFEPRLIDGTGLEKIKEGKYKFKNYVETLGDKAAKDYGSNAAQLGKEKFTEAVNIQWDSDIKDRVYPELVKKRIEYQTEANLDKLASLFLPDSGCEMKILQPITECYLDLSIYEDVATWTEANGNQSGIISNYDWCVNLIQTHRPLWEPLVHEYVNTNICGRIGQTFLCPSIDEYKCCTKAMSSIGEQDLCGINSAIAGKELAEQIVAELKAEGSKMEYQIIAPDTFFSTMPAQVICKRPTQVSNCSGKAHTPGMPDIVNCILDEDPAYTNLRNQVSAEVDALNNEFPQDQTGGLFKIDSYDPLIVTAPSKDVWDQLSQEDRQFSFGSFTYNLAPRKISNPIDGLDSPALTCDAGFNKIKTKLGKPIQTAVAKPNPAEQITNSALVDEVMVKPDVQSSKIKTLAKQPVALNTPQAGQPQKLMSASVPHQTTRSNIQLEKTVKIAGKKSRWGSTFSIRDNDSDCRVNITYTILNQGDASSVPFQMKWAQLPSIHPAFIGPIPAKGKFEKTDTLQLQQGANRITLLVDPTHRLQEDNRKGEPYTLTILMQGTCGKTGGNVKPSAIKKSPGFRKSTTQKRVE